MQFKEESKTHKRLAELREKPVKCYLDPYRDYSAFEILSKFAKYAGREGWSNPDIRLVVDLVKANPNAKTLETIAPYITRHNSRNLSVPITNPRLRRPASGLSRGWFVPR